MNFEEQFVKVLTAWLSKQLNTEITKIYDYEQRTEESGGCETCAFTDTYIEICYQADTFRYYTYYGDFAALVRELGEVEL